MSRLLLVVAWTITLNGCATLDGGFRSSSGQTPDPAKLSPRSSPAVNPANPAFIEDRARQAYATGRWDVAEGYYLQLTRLKPQDAAPWWFQLGNLYAEQGRLDSAERAYRESLRRHDDARTLHNLGLVQIKLGIGAVREAQTRLPSSDTTQQETRELLRTLLETAF